MATHLSIGTEVRRGVRVLAAAGEVDVSNADRLDDALVRGLRRGTALVVDLTGIEFFGSGGTRALVGAERAAAAEGADLLIVPSACVSYVLEIAGATELFDQYTNLRAALESARRAGGAA